MDVWLFVAMCEIVVSPFQKKMKHTDKAPRIALDAGHGICFQGTNSSLQLKTCFSCGLKTQNIDHMLSHPLLCTEPLPLLENACFQRAIQYD